MCRSVSDPLGRNKVLSLCTGSGSDLVASLLEGFDSCGFEICHHMAMPITARVQEVQRTMAVRPWSAEWMDEFNLYRETYASNRKSRPGLVEEGDPSPADLERFLEIPAWNGEPVEEGVEAILPSATTTAVSEKTAAAQPLDVDTSDKAIWNEFRRRAEFKQWCEGIVEDTGNAEGSLRTAFKMAREAFFSLGAVVFYKDLWRRALTDNLEPKALRTAKTRATTEIILVFTESEFLDADMVKERAAEDGTVYDQTVAVPREDPIISIEYKDTFDVDSDPIGDILH
jgi:hypothetical protein